MQYNNQLDCDTRCHMRADISISTAIASLASNEQNSAGALHGLDGQHQ